LRTQGPYRKRNHRHKSTKSGWLYPTLKSFVS